MITLLFEMILARLALRHRVQTGRHAVRAVKRDGGASSNKEAPMNPVTSTNNAASNTRQGDPTRSSCRCRRMPTKETRSIPSPWTARRSAACGLRQRRQMAVLPPHDLGEILVRPLRALVHDNGRSGSGPCHVVQDGSDPVPHLGVVSKQDGVRVRLVGEVAARVENFVGKATLTEVR